MDEFLQGAGYGVDSLALLINAVIAFFLLLWAAWQVTAHGKASVEEVQTSDNPAAVIPLLWKILRVVILVVVMLWILA